MEKPSKQDEEKIFDSFRNGIIFLSGIENCNFFSEEQIKDIFIKNVSFKEQENKYQLFYKNTGKICNFSILKPILYNNENWITNNYEERICKEGAKKHNILQFSIEKNKSFIDVISFIKDNISPKSFVFSEEKVSKEDYITIDVNLTVIIDINNILFIGNVVINFDFRNNIIPYLKIENLIPAYKIFSYYKNVDTNKIILFKSIFFDNDNGKTKEFLLVVKELLSSIDSLVSGVNNEVFERIINSPIFDFKEDIGNSERIFRISFLLNDIFKEDIFTTEDCSCFLYNLYLSGEKDIKYIKNKISENIKKYRENLILYVNKDKLFGLGKSPLNSEEFNEIIKNKNIKKYLSKNTINVIETRRKDDYNKGKNYVRNVFSIPLDSYSKLDFNLKRIEEKLEKNIYGMGVVKSKILNHLAVMSRSPNATPPILCLSGPPGIGKTMICEIIADSVNRNFDIISCSGMSDSFSLIGMSYGYSSSEQGNIIKSLIKCGTMNPLLLIDEIDKTSKGSHGSPQEALIPIFDPQQNYRFEDRYIGFPIDISKIQFITTVNDINAISEPLRDRMIIIEMDGYSDADKIEIMKNFTIPKIMKDYNIREDEVIFTKNAEKQIINECSDEAGIRKIEGIVKEILAKAIYLIETKNNKEKIIVENINNFIYNINSNSIGF